MTHVYGLGQEFSQPRLGGRRLDRARAAARAWSSATASRASSTPSVGNVQIPVLYALGPGTARTTRCCSTTSTGRAGTSPASPWRARMFGDQLRFYVMTGPDLPDLRADYHGADRPPAGAAAQGLRPLGLGVRLRQLGPDRRADGRPARRRLPGRRLRARPQLVRRRRARPTRRERDGPARLGPGPGAAPDRQPLLLPRPGRRTSDATPTTASGWWRSRNPTSPTPPPPSPRCRPSSPPTAAPTGAATRRTRAPVDGRAGLLGRRPDDRLDRPRRRRLDPRRAPLPEPRRPRRHRSLDRPRRARELRPRRLLRRRRDDGGRRARTSTPTSTTSTTSCGTRRSGTATSPAPASRTASASPTRGPSS